MNYSFFNCGTDFNAAVAPVVYIDGKLISVVDMDVSFNANIGRHIVWVRGIFPEEAQLRSFKIDLTKNECVEM